MVQNMSSKVHVWDMSVFNKSFLTCKTGKGWLFTVLLVLTSACDLSVEALVLNVCKKGVFVMSEEGELWEIGAWVAVFHAQ